MDIDKFNKICTEIAEGAREKQKEPMDFEEIIMMYEEANRKIRH